MCLRTHEGYPLIFRDNLRLALRSHWAGRARIDRPVLELAIRQTADCVASEALTFAQRLWWCGIAINDDLTLAIPQMVVAFLEISDSTLRKRLDEWGWKAFSLSCRILRTTP
jgi:hypothetical protein